MATTEEKKSKGTLINILDLEPAEGAKGIPMLNTHSK